MSLGKDFAVLRNNLGFSLEEVHSEIKIPKSVLESIENQSQNLCAMVFTFVTVDQLCNPVVGSSSIYIVLPVDLFDNSLANLILCASPPDNVVAC